MRRRTSGSQHCTILCSGFDNDDDSDHYDDCDGDNDDDDDDI